MVVPDSLRAALAGRYTLERELGAGGMATVYLAHDLRHDRKVALKLLREELSASLGKERFLREIKVAAALQHPHILPLYDSGAADNLLYYVMPYVDGPSLRDRLAKEGELPIGEAVRILRDVADALTEAHRHGVVHRDLKPENVMLRGRHALVMDFGVAKALSEATGRQSLTTVGVALGTPTYMAPEQAVADPHVDHRADIYAFGVVAYELLAGRPPFTGATPQQVLAAHVTAAPEPVTAYRAVPPALAALVMRCLEKRPADRWQSAEELVPQLEALMTPSGGITPTATQPVAAAAAPAPGVPAALGARARRACWSCSASAPGARPTADRRGITLRSRGGRRQARRRASVHVAEPGYRRCLPGRRHGDRSHHHPGRHDRPARGLPQLDLCPQGEDRSRGRHGAPRRCDGGGHGREGGRPAAGDRVAGQCRRRGAALEPAVRCHREGALPPAGFGRRRDRLGPRRRSRPARRRGAGGPPDRQPRGPRPRPPRSVPDRAGHRGRAARGDRAVPARRRARFHLCRPMERDRPGLVLPRRYVHGPAPGRAADAGGGGKSAGARPHVGRGARAARLLLATYLRDFAAAEPEYLRAIALDSTTPFGGDYGWVLHARGLDDSALAVVRRARRHNPFSFAPANLAVVIFLDRGMLDSATAACQALRRLAAADNCDVSSPDPARPRRRGGHADDGDAPHRTGGHAHPRRGIGSGR